MVTNAPPHVLEGMNGVREPPPSMTRVMMVCLVIGPILTYLLCWTDGTCKIENVRGDVIIVGGLWIFIATFMCIVIKCEAPASGIISEPPTRQIPV